MLYLENIARNAASIPTTDAVRNSSGQSCTYAELWARSEAIAAYLDGLGLEAGKPIMVYGHKDPLMVCSFLGCLKAGHPYVPVDFHSVPTDRVANIIAQIDNPVVIATEEFPAIEAACQLIDRGALEALVAEGVVAGAASDSTHWVDGEDLMYIIFTSGSTGAPKGVMVTAACLDNFCQWALTLGGTPRAGKVFLNQAPFSFDLSVYELAQALWCGGTLFSLTKDSQASMKLQQEALAAAGINVWVSTPSFADVCMADKSFDASVCQDIDVFLFCGETLTNTTARALHERFPGSVVMNTYGPTESTVAVTGTVVTPEMAAQPTPLTVGVPRKGTCIRIVDEAGNDVPAGEHGEIVIVGDTVAKGYFGRPDLTAKAFSEVELDGKQVRAYRTGDEGWLDAEGNLQYRGRLDLQIKMNGFRIELGEIEEHMLRLPQVSAVCVVPAMKEGKISHLVAHVVSSGPRTESDFREGLALKEALKAGLPHYMIPKKVVFHEQLPMTPNGKTDRKALQKA